MYTHVKFATVCITLEEGAKTPSYATHGAAGADLYAFLPDGPYTLVRGARGLIPTGVKIMLPQGFEGQVRPRSGLALNHGITVLNSPGTIDEDYRGEIKVILRNGSNKDYVIKHGDRIAQLVIAPFTRAAFLKQERLTETERGSGGFGSSGV
jgi:dUTP pyrophosphatase